MMKQIRRVVLEMYDLHTDDAANLVRHLMWNDSFNCSVHQTVRIRESMRQSLTIYRRRMADFRVKYTPRSYSIVSFGLMNAEAYDRAGTTWMKQSLDKREVHAILH